MSARDDEVAHAVCDAAAVFGVPVLGMSGTRHEVVYAERGIGFVAEYCADLDYADDGALIITREHHARDPVEALARTRRAFEQRRATSINGGDIPMRADCVCVHSDTPGAVELARAIRAGLV